MFIDFLYELRARKLHVSAHEWMTLMQGLALGLHDSSLDGFYQLARSVCVKDVAHYDAFDEAFLAYFKDIHGDALALTEELMRWLQDPAQRRQLSAEERALLEALDLDELRRRFEERLREQTDRHDRGNRWIGTGGTSPFGNGGTFPGGIRVGGMGGGRSAMQVAGERRFRAYRKDVVLDVRQIDLALRDLCQLGREGAPDELDIDDTVDETCKNAGELELVFHPPRRNRVKLILMMDVGGTMDPYAELVSRLFTAASRSGRFARFRSYYFHNCIYERVYESAHFKEGVPVPDLLAHSDRDERLVIVGDAWMHPAELLQPGGSIFYSHYNRSAGIDWLRRLREHFRRIAWLNPEPKRFWGGSTIELIAGVIPMWPLTIDGIEGAVRYLVRGGRTPALDED
ncbi:vWA domain-containing protein [Haliangium sp.]|uniref:vWA domain-containing protein n=1 Tax=Haliangium sp. TaxID=2663208 RepID=UPI003D113C44